MSNTNLFVDCVDTVYKVTFPRDAERQLDKLSRVLSGILDPNIYWVRVLVSEGVCSIIISEYETIL